MIRQVFQLINKTTVGHICFVVLAWWVLIVGSGLFGAASLASIYFSVTLCIAVAVDVTAWLLILLVPVLFLVLLVGNVWLWVMLSRNVYAPIVYDFLDFDSF